MKKTLAVIFVVLVAAGILLLTFQNSYKSVELSESVRLWLMDHGMTIGGKDIRRYIHIPIYFLLGIAIGVALVVFGGNIRWKNGRLWLGVLIGCAFGFLDESFKIFLQGREFDIYDLIRDGIGVLIGVSVISLIAQKKT